jgi:hypothetical protein
MKSNEELLCEALGGAEQRFRRGIWPNRDPLHEGAGYNLYDFVSNDPLNRFDVLGLAEGSFTVSYTSIHLNEEDAQRRGQYSVRGFDVKYTPTKAHSS